MGKKKLISCEFVWTLLKLFCIFHLYTKHYTVFSGDVGKKKELISILSIRVVWVDFSLFCGLSVISKLIKARNDLIPTSFVLLCLSSLWLVASWLLIDWHSPSSFWSRGWQRQGGLWHWCTCSRSPRKTFMAFVQLQQNDRADFVGPGCSQCSPEK